MATRNSTSIPMGIIDLVELPAGNSADMTVVSWLGRARRTMSVCEVGGVCSELDEK